MTSLQHQLIEADRATQLRFLSQLIGELTIRARFYYSEPDNHSRLVETNEAIHCVAGHLRDLLDEDEPMTASRAEAISANAGLLPGSQLETLVSWSRL